MKKKTVRSPKNTTAKKIHASDITLKGNRLTVKGDSAEIIADAAKLAKMSPNKLVSEMLWFGIMQRASAAEAAAGPEPLEKQASRFNWVHFCMSNGFNDGGGRGIAYAGEKGDTLSLVTLSEGEQPKIKPIAHAEAAEVMREMVLEERRYQLDSKSNAEALCRWYSDLRQMLAEN